MMVVDQDIKVGYKQTIVGIIPQDWNLVKIGDVARVTGGNAFKSEDYTDEGVHLVRISNIKDGSVQLDEVKVPYDSNLNRFLLNQGDLLIAMSGATTGKTGVFKTDAQAYLNQRVGRIKAKSIDTKYLNQFVNTGRFKFEILLDAAGGAQPNISNGDIEKIKLPLPPLPEQRKIAEILSTWDEAIAQTKALIEQLKLRNKGLAQQLLTGKKRLKGFSGEWKEVRLGDHITKYSVTTTENNQYPVLTSSRNGLFFQRDYYGKQVASENNIGYNIVPYGYFTYRHMSDDLVFKFNVNYLCENGIVSTLYPVFRTNDSILTDFLLLVLNEGNELKRHALKQKQGGSRTYMYLNKLSELKLSLPALQEQQAIIDFLDVISKELNIYELQLQEFIELKKGLMQKLLTGEVRVNTNCQE